MHACAPTTILAIAGLFLLHLPSAVGQVVSPFATHDCSGALFYSGDHYCNNNPSTCCAFSGLCCAGGCCPELATCVFQGTANEACCNLSDSTLCGSVQPVSSKTCPNPAGPSVPCSGVDTNWYCAHGCTCDVSRDHGCNCFGGSGSCSGSGGGSDSSSAAAPTSTEPAPVDSSSSEDTASSTPAASASSGSAATTSVASNGGVSSAVSAPSTTAGAGAGGGSPSSASSAAAAAGTTTKASGAVLRVQAAWAVGLCVLLVGTIVLL